MDPRPATAAEHSSGEEPTSMVGRLVMARIEALELGRWAELNPSPRARAEARRAFALATSLAGLAREASA